MINATDEIRGLVQDGTSDLRQIDSDKDLQVWYKKYLSKRGLISQLSQKIPHLPPDQRPQFGSKLNNAKQELTSLYQQKDKDLTPKRISGIKTDKYIDPTVPGQPIEQGHLNPLTSIRLKTEDIFVRMGFQIFEAPEIDDDYHNFESLNMPPQHPARDMWDTFWTETGHVLITHTSTMQHRILSQNRPPIRAIIPGRCFRHEALDASHEHTLFQIEGLLVDKGIKLPDLIGTFNVFLNEFFQRQVKIKIQPSHFPFVEPGIEFLLDCSICSNTGKTPEGKCSTCKGSGWIELAGAGMIHPFVLKEAGIDHNMYQGFAWGFGLDRLVMLKYQIEDIRHLRSGDLRFIRQF